MNDDTQISDFGLAATGHREASSFLVAESQPALTRDREKPNSWFEKCTRKLQAIARLRANWDSYGSLPPSSVSLCYANAFLSFIRQKVGIEEPAISPSPNGNTCFEWDDGQRTLIVEFDDKGQQHYFFEKDGNDIEGIFTDSRLLVSLLTRV